MKKYLDEQFRMVKREVREIREKIVEKTEGLQKERQDRTDGKETANVKSIADLKDEIKGLRHKEIDVGLRLGTLDERERTKGIGEGGRIGEAGEILREMVDKVSRIEKKAEIEE